MEDNKVIKLRCRHFDINMSDKCRDNSRTKGVCKAAWQRVKKKFDIASKNTALCVLIRPRRCVKIKGIMSGNGHCDNYETFQLLQTKFFQFKNVGNKNQRNVVN